jgi:hypothetical protein
MRALACARRGALARSSTWEWLRGLLTLSACCARFLLLRTTVAPWQSDERNTANAPASLWGVFPGGLRAGDFPGYFFAQAPCSAWVNLSARALSTSALYRLQKRITARNALASASKFVSAQFAKVCAEYFRPLLARAPLGLRGQYAGRPEIQSAPAKKGPEIENATRTRRPKRPVAFAGARYLGAPDIYIFIVFSHHGLMVRKMALSRGRRKSNPFGRPEIPNPFWRAMLYIYNPPCTRAFSAHCSAN